MAVNALFQRFNDFLFSNKKSKKGDEFPFSMPDGFNGNADIYLLIFQSNMIKAKIQRVLESVPEAFHGIGLYRDVLFQESKLEELLKSKFGESHVLYTKKGAGESKFISKDEFASQLESVLDQVDDLLKASELSVSLLKQSSFSFYNDKWGQLSRELKLAVHNEGFLPNQLSEVEHLCIEMPYRLNRFHYDVFKGINALENIFELEIKGKLDSESDFNKLAQLSRLNKLSLEEGPKIKWPNDSLHIDKGFMLEEVFVRNAQKSEAYQFIYSLERVKKITLMNFNKQNIYHILDFLIYKDLEEINIHFSSKIIGAKDGLLEDIINPYSGNVKVNFYQPTEGMEERVLKDNIYW
ncbi:hypothetical protein [Echinicola shivajiensis]|uniref:hypothetical protein n=1 Tax=Echinicola shivajiensis TaxID=1035916 RepID=UPI001BFC2650|nr:hypothetical protein [Echinicola shivajiensis]